MPTLGTALRDRFTRLRPSFVPGPYLAWAIGCWLLAVAVLLVVVIPGWSGGVRAEEIGESGAIGVFEAPLPLRALLVASGAVIAGSFTIVRELRRRVSGNPRRIHTVVRELWLVLCAGAPALVLLADRAWLFAIVALAFALLAELFAHGRERISYTRHDGLLGILVAAPWVVLLGYQFTPEGSRTGSWVWIASFGVAAGFAAFATYYGVARAAERRANALGFLFREPRSPALVLAVVVLAAVVVGLRLTALRDLFPDPDPALWSPFRGSPLAWLHAVLVAGLVAWFALRSSRRPLRESGERRITAALAGVGNAHLVLAVGAIGVGLVAAALTGDVVLLDGWTLAVPWVKVAGVAVIGLLAVLPGFRGTAGRALAVVTAAYLVPVTLQNALGDAVPVAIRGFAASPVHVTIVLVAIGLVGAVVNVIRPGKGSVHIRLAVVPLVAVHAGWLLPAAWSLVGTVVLVAGVVLAILVLLPPVAADRRKHTFTVLGASAGQLLALAIVVLAIPSFVDDPSIVVLGLFWLSVAVVAALTIETERPATPAAPESPAEERPAAERA